MNSNTQDTTTKKKSALKKTRIPKAKRDLFVAEYLRTLNATQSAIKAGYSPSGARLRGHELLHTPEIKAEIDKALAERTEQCGVDTEFVLQGLKDIALNESVPYKDRVKAYDLLGRYTQCWTGRENKATPQTVSIVFKGEE